MAGHWHAASSDEPMREGVHFAEFTIARKACGVFVGVIRPGWDVGLCDVTGAHDTGAATLYGHCLYYSLSGKRWPDNTAWDGMQPSREGDRVGLLLDLDQGSMTVYKNGEWIGVMRAAGLTGEYCWAASLGAAQDCVHINSKPVPDRTDQQLAAASAAACAHAQNVQQAAARAADHMERVQRELAVFDVKETQEVVSAETLLARGRSRSQRKDDGQLAADRTLAEAKHEAEAAALRERQRKNEYYLNGKKFIGLERARSHAQLTVERAADTEQDQTAALKEVVALQRTKSQRETKPVKPR